jgi:hypothetical protein
MRSRTTAHFRALLQALPAEAQRQADEAYKLFSDNPFHPSLYFKRVRGDRPLYSVRIGRRYRALGYRRGDGMLWIWIGSHAEYDHVIERL